MSRKIKVHCVIDLRCHVYLWLNADYADNNKSKIQFWHSLAPQQAHAISIQTRTANSNGNVVDTQPGIILNEQMVPSPKLIRINHCSHYSEISVFLAKK